MPVAGYVHEGVWYASEREYLAEAGNLVNAEQAAQRVEFQLSYTRAPQRRGFSPGELTGPELPCAYHDGATQAGGWERPDDGIPNTFRSVDEWIDRYASYAVAEAVHEALEWFRIDGRPWLDPHGPGEHRVHDIVDEFVAQLAALRHTGR